MPGAIGIGAAGFGAGAGFATCVVTASNGFTTCVVVESVGDIVERLVERLRVKAHGVRMERGAEHAGGSGTVGSVGERTLVGSEQCNCHVTTR